MAECQGISDEGPLCLDGEFSDYVVYHHSKSMSITIFIALIQLIMAH